MTNFRFWMGLLYEVLRIIAPLMALFALGLILGGVVQNEQAFFTNGLLCAFLAALTALCARQLRCFEL